MAVEISNVVHAMGALVLAGAGVPSLGAQDGFSSIARTGAGAFSVGLEQPVRPLVGPNLPDVVLVATLGASGFVVSAAPSADGASISVTIFNNGVAADIATVLNLVVLRLPTQT